MKRIMLCAVLLLPLLTLAQSNRNSFRSSNRNSGRNDRTAATAAGSSYQVLITRNMFMPDRTTGHEPVAPDLGPRFPGHNVEKVLTGVALQETAKDSSPAAFFLDPNTDETIRVTIGQSLDGMAIRSISFEGVDVASGRSTRVIHLGENLSGIPVSSFSDSETPEVTSQPASGTSQFISSPVNTLEERMRQRRQQEK